MLRASINDSHAGPVNLDVGQLVSEATPDVEIEHAAAIDQFVKAICASDPLVLAGSRVALSVAASPEFASTVAAVSGNFHMMNRILDATGLPYRSALDPIAAELGLA